MEAARGFGLAARFVTGYLYDPLSGGSVESGEASIGGGATHAWVQIFLPGAGWVEFDPTNGSVGGDNLIRVGVTRDPSQAVPIRDSYFSPAEAFENLDVEVTVRRSKEGL